MEAKKLVPGHWLELIPRDPPAAMPGLVWIVYVESWNAPYLSVTDDKQGFLMRVDENGELCVRELDGSLWEIGRSVRWGAN